MIVVTITGLKKVQGLHNAMGERARNLIRPWTWIFKDVVRNIRKQFTSQGAHFGTTWPPLNPDYAAWKEKHFGRLPILVRSKRLKKSLTRTAIGMGLTEAAAEKEDSFLTIQRLEFMFGTKVPYADKHQKGDGVPKRTIIRLVPKMTQRWSNWIGGYILTGRKTGG